MNEERPQAGVDRVLWMAILASVVLVSGIGAFLPVPPGIVPPPVIVPVLAFLAVGVAVTSFVLPLRVRALAYARVAEHVESEVDRTAPAGYREVSARRVLRRSEVWVAPLVARLRAPFILSIALSEAIALFGLVLTRVGVPAVQAAPFFAAGFVLVAIRFPSLERTLEAAARANGAVLE